jgi:hypothetical protein
MGSTATAAGSTKKAAPPIVYKGDRAALGLPAKEPKPIGRPPCYTFELSETVLRRVSLGESLRHIGNDPDMPSEPTIRSWCVDDLDGFFQRYARARRLQADAWADRIIEISEEDTEPNDRRVRIDALKWTVSKMFPDRYGDKLQVGGDPDNPIRVLHQVVKLDTLSNVELEALELFARARVAARVIEHEPAESLALPVG